MYWRVLVRLEDISAVEPAVILWNASQNQHQYKASAYSKLVTKESLPATVHDYWEEYVGMLPCPVWPSLPQDMQMYNVYEKGVAVGAKANVKRFKETCHLKRSWQCT